MADNKKAQPGSAREYLRQYASPDFIEWMTDSGLFEDERFRRVVSQGLRREPKKGVVNGESPAAP